MIENLAVDTFNVLYPISFTLNNNGQITDIHNFEELNQRWKTFKDTLKQNRRGEVLDNYLLLAENALKNKKNLLDKLKTNWFIHTFFLGIYKTYGETYEVDTIISFPFTQGIRPFDYQTKQQISKYLDDYAMIQLTMEGELIDKRTAKDFEYKLSESYFPESRKLTGSFYAKYFIDPKYNRVDTFITECTLNTEQAKVITIKVSSIN